MNQVTSTGNWSTIKSGNAANDKKLNAKLKDKLSFVWNWGRFSLVVQVSPPETINQGKEFSYYELLVLCVLYLASKNNTFCMTSS